jgi:hypothetical protein
MTAARTSASPLLRRWQLLVATLIAVPGMALALAVGDAASASAAGPATIGPGANVIFPSWFWGSTTVCATNTGSAAGTVTVDPWPWGDGVDTIAVPASGRGCTSGWWWANILQVTNRGSTSMVVESR